MEGGVLDTVLIVFPKNSSRACFLHVAHLTTFPPLCLPRRTFHSVLQISLVIVTMASAVFSAIGSEGGIARSSFETTEKAPKQKQMSEVYEDMFFDHVSESEDNCEDSEEEWSFVTAPDASFEGFDDLSLLTEEDGSHLVDEEDKWSVEKGGKIELALKDSALLEFLLNMTR